MFILKTFYQFPSDFKLISALCLVWHDEAILKWFYIKIFYFQNILSNLKLVWIHNLDTISNLFCPLHLFLKRSWNQVYAVQTGTSLSFFKDKKSKLQEVTFHNEHPVDLTNAEVQMAGDYTKKKHVFRLK